MSRVNGQLLTCDRCGANTFLKHIGDKTLDGGYTKFNRFEDKPEGWGSPRDVKYLDLCPLCYDVYKRTLEKFVTAAGIKDTGAD